MALVKITNGDVTSLVSRGAYEKQYKDLGFHIVGDKPEKKEKKAEAPKVEDIPEPVAEPEPDEVDAEADGEDAEIEELLEKPLSQWSNDELKLFVTAKNIDTSSAKKTSEVRAIVKKYLDDEAKNAAEA